MMKLYIDETLYKNIHDAETFLKIDYIKAGTSLRLALEYFINKLIDQHNMTEDIAAFCEASTLKNKPSPDSLFGKLLFLSDTRAVQKAKSVHKGVKPLICKIQTKPRFLEDYNVSTTFIDFSGNTVSRKKVPDDKRINPFHFIRNICNSCSHDTGAFLASPYNRNYENVLECFKITYHMLACFFDDPAKFRYYDTGLIPLGRYEITKAFVPEDSERTGCTMEYEARACSIGNYTEWAIIREYNKNNVDKNFALREQQTTILKRHNRAGVPSARVEIITNFDDEETPFYIIAYNFTRKPQKLEDIIKNIDYSERYDICLNIVEHFQKLHNSPTPIYHRMLNHNCVYLEDCSDIGSGWDVSVLKFHFSKIVSNKNIYTVFMQAKHASNITADESEKKYIAPEWSMYEEILDWDKIDIFSLGVLFADILSGKIAKNMKELLSSAKDLKELGVTNEVFALLNAMMSPMYINRPDINTVVEILEKFR